MMSCPSPRAARHRRRRYYVLTMLLLLLLAAVLTWNDRAAARHKHSLCGVWEAVLPRGRLCIRAAAQGYEILLPKPGGGIRRYPLEGCRTPYFRQGGRRVFLYVSQSGRELLLLPGDSYRRVEETYNQTTPNHDHE